MRLSTRPIAVVSLLGLLLCVAAPAEAARSSSKRKSSSKRSEKRSSAPAKKKVSATAPAPKQQTKRASRTRRTPRDASLRGRFASIPAPKVPGASKLRLEWRASGAGDGRSGTVFRAAKLKAKGPAGSSFATKVRASTRKALRKQ